MFNVAKVEKSLQHKFCKLSTSLFNAVAFLLLFIAIETSSNTKQAIEMPLWFISLNREKNLTRDDLLVRFFQFASFWLFVRILHSRPMHGHCACGESDAMPFHQIEIQTFPSFIAFVALYYFLSYLRQSQSQIDLKPIARHSLFKAIEEFIALSCAIDRTQQKWKLTCLTANNNQILPDTCTRRWNIHRARRKQQFIPTLFSTVSGR